MRFYDRYLELCNEKGVKPSSDAMSTVADISKMALSKWSRQIEYPSVKTAVRLSEYFGVSLEYMLGLTDIRNHGLTDDEKQLLEDFRSVDIKGRHQIIAACDRIREESETRAVLEDAQ